jgi:predicted secreted hydrolase
VLDEILKDLEKAATEVVDSVVEVFFGPPETLSKPSPERMVELPRDTFAHSDVQTEWWYYTGHLQSEESQFGFELVFFKRQTALDRIGKIIPMRVITPVSYYSHFAITDIGAKQFRYAHRRSLDGSRPAGASTDCHNVWLDNWRVRELNNHHILTATMNKTQLELVLKPSKPIVKQGQDGLSYKDAGEASYYLSYTRMQASGELFIGEKHYQVTGTAWMDHEFGTWTMKEKIQGWDWFALQLDNDQEIMAFFIRGADGKPTPYSEATFIDSDGSTRRFSFDEFSIIPTGEWTSPITNTSYPSGWQLHIPSLGVELSIEPALRCQELDTRGSTMVVYWEGAATVSGRMQEKSTTGRAYVELVGYDRSHEDLTLYDYFLSEVQYRSLGFY